MYTLQITYTRCSIVNGPLMIRESSIPDGEEAAKFFRCRELCARLQMFQDMWYM